MVGIPSETGGKYATIHGSGVGAVIWSGKGYPDSIIKYQMDPKIR
jgi:hypothetical protein